MKNPKAVHHERGRKIHPELSPSEGVDSAKPHLMDGKTRMLVIVASLLALFLGALDALVVGAAMPTIVAELGGLSLYSWVFSSYLLARAISLPIFGKLCDLFGSKKLYIAAIAIFVVSSILAGAARSMTQLIVFRALQGIGAGGNFALAYIVVADLSSPEKRGKMMGFISFVWGIASLMGPAMGGFIVSYWSWPWIFYINVPVGGLALLGIMFYLKDTHRGKADGTVDYAGALTLSAAVLGLLTAFMLAGRTYTWLSPQILCLFGVSAAAVAAFIHVERKAKDPILELSFFRIPGFSLGNAGAFFSSFAIFSLSSFSPLFIQGALGKTPAQLGVAMIPLSLGWSAGALLCGQLVRHPHEKSFSLLGAVTLVVSSGLTLTFSPSTSLPACALVFGLAGLGMGFVSIATLLIVQRSLEPSDLGVATSSHQFARTLGGTVGIGVAGSFVTERITQSMDTMMRSPLGSVVPESLAAQLTENVQSLFQPEIQAVLPEAVLNALQGAVGQGMEMVFLAVFGASLVSLFFCLFLPAFKRSS